MTLLRLVVAAAALTFACAFEAADPEPGAAFNKEELEKILRAEHSTKISNVYDSENGIQCAAPHRAPRMQPPSLLLPPLLPPPPRCRRHRRRISRRAAVLLPPPPPLLLPPPRLTRLPLSSAQVHVEHRAAGAVRRRRRRLLQGRALAAP